MWFGSSVASYFYGTTKGEEKRPGVPIALCGKHAHMTDEFIKLMAPEYDVVHVCHSAPAAMSELRALAKGEETIPSSEMGTNVTGFEFRYPKAIYVGGGFSPSEVEEIWGVEAIRSIPLMWIPPNKRRRMPDNKPPPVPSFIPRVKKRLADFGLIEGREHEVEADLWEF